MADEEVADVSSLSLSGIVLEVGNVMDVVVLSLSDRGGRPIEDDLMSLLKYGREIDLSLSLVARKDDRSFAGMVDEGWTEDTNEVKEFESLSLSSNERIVVRRQSDDKYADTEHCDEWHHVTPLASDLKSSWESTLTFKSATDEVGYANS